MRSARIRCVVRVAARDGGAGRLAPGVSVRSAARWEDQRLRFYLTGTPESVTENAARSRSSNSVVGSRPCHRRQASARALSSVRAATTRRSRASGCSTFQCFRSGESVVTGTSPVGCPSGTPALRRSPPCVPGSVPASTSTRPPHTAAPRCPCAHLRLAGFCPDPRHRLRPSRSLLAGVSRCPETGVSEVLARLGSAGGCSDSCTARRVERGGRAPGTLAAPRGTLRRRSERFRRLPHQRECDPDRREPPDLRLTASMGLCYCAAVVYAPRKRLAALRSSMHLRYFQARPTKLNTPPS